MLKKILILFTSIVLFSCQIQYDGESKYIVKTKVVDKNGNPIENSKVSIYVSTGYYGDEISLTTSDKDGNALLMFPPPESDDAEFSISYTDEFNTYFSKEIYNLKKSDFKDYVFNTGTVILLKKEDVTEFTVLRENVNQNTQITSFSTDAISAGDTIDITSEVGYYFPISILVLKNQTFKIKYSITDYNDFPNTVTEFSQEVTVGDEPSTYTIVY